MKIKNTFFFFICLFSYWSIVQTAYADTLSNEQFIIHLQETENNSSIPKPLSQNPDVMIQKGYPFTTNDWFGFSVLENPIDFGELAPTDPSTRSTNLKVSGSGYGFQVYAYENHRLQTTDRKNFIPSTSCDDGQCTEKIASAWTGPLTYGFGYRCDSDIAFLCSSDFDNHANFKLLSENDIAQAETMISGFSQNASAKITYKLIIPQTQTRGIYTNTISYIAVPNL